MDNDKGTLLEKEVHKLAQQLEIPVERIYEVLEEHYLQEGDGQDGVVGDDGGAIQQAGDQKAQEENKEGNEEGSGDGQDTGGDPRRPEGGEIDDSKDDTGIDFDAEPPIDGDQIIHE